MYPYLHAKRIWDISTYNYGALSYRPYCLWRELNAATCCALLLVPYKGLQVFPTCLNRSVIFCYVFFKLTLGCENLFLYSFFLWVIFFFEQYIKTTIFRCRVSVSNLVGNVYYNFALGGHWSRYALRSNWLITYGTEFYTRQVGVQIRLTSTCSILN